MTRAFVLVALCAAGCAHGRPTASYVQGVGQADGPVLAQAVAQAVKSGLPPSKAPTVTLQRAGRGDVVGQPLAEALITLGYTVAADGSPAGKNAPVVRYEVFPVADGLALRVEVGEMVASRWLSRTTSGELEPAATVLIGRLP